MNTKKEKKKNHICTCIHWYNFLCIEKKIYYYRHVSLSLAFISSE